MVKMYISHSVRLHKAKISADSSVPTLSFSLTILFLAEQGFLTRMQEREWRGRDSFQFSLAKCILSHWTICKSLHLILKSNAKHHS